MKRLAASFEVAGRNRGFTDEERREINLAVVRGYRERMLQAAESRVLDAWYDQLDTDRFMAFLDEERQREAARRQAGEEHRRRPREGAHEGQHAGGVEAHRGGRRPAADHGRPAAHRADRAARPGRAHARAGGGLDAGGAGVVPDDPPARRTIRCGSSRTCTWRARSWASAASARGRGSCCCEGRDDSDPLLLQAKQAEASVLERFLPPSEYDNHGERVVRGQRLMQAASDIFLGWHRQAGFDGVDRDFYIRQLHDWKGAADVEAMVPSGARVYARVCGETLARAHARRATGSRSRRTSGKRPLRPGDRRVRPRLRRPERARLRRLRRRGAVGPARGGRDGLGLDRVRRVGHGLPARRRSRHNVPGPSLV